MVGAFVGFGIEMSRSCERNLREEEDEESDIPLLDFGETSGEAFGETCGETFVLSVFNQLCRSICCMMMVGKESKSSRWCFNGLGPRCSLIVPAGACNKLPLLL